jgi:hypothetical protein
MLGVYLGERPQPEDTMPNTDPDYSPYALNPDASRLGYTNLNTTWASRWGSGPLTATDRRKVTLRRRIEDLAAERGENLTAPDGATAAEMQAILNDLEDLT